MGALGRGSGRSDREQVGGQPQVGENLGGHWPGGIAFEGSSHTFLRSYQTSEG